MDCGATSGPSRQGFTGRYQQNTAIQVGISALYGLAHTRVVPTLVLCHQQKASRPRGAFGEVSRDPATASSGSQLVRILPDLATTPAGKDLVCRTCMWRADVCGAGCSDVFEVGGFEWKLEMYPYGDSQSDKTLSVFLCAVDRKQVISVARVLPCRVSAAFASVSEKMMRQFTGAAESNMRCTQLPGWSQTAHYQIAVVNNKDPSKTSTHTGYDIFRGKRDSAWGWSKLINLSKLHDASQGWADEDGKITLQATVHVVTHEYMPVKRTYRKSLCGLYYERVLQSYFEPFLKDELQRLDKLCGNSVLHKGFSDFWTALPDARKRMLLQITMDEVLLNVKARLFSRDQPATYLAADVIFKAAFDCDNGSHEAHKKTKVGCTSISVIGDDKEDEGTVLRLERNSGENAGHHDCAEDSTAGVKTGSAATTSAASTSSRVMLRTHKGVIRMSNSANFVDVFRAQVSDALDNVRALVKHLKPQSCDGACLEAMGRQMLAVFAMCGMYITNVHPAYHEKLALQLQEDLIREEEEKAQKADAKKAKQADKRKKQQGIADCLELNQACVPCSGLLLPSPFLAHLRLGRFLFSCLP